MTRQGTNCFRNQTSQSDAAYSYRVYVRDQISNTGVSSSRTVTLDRVNPALRIFSPNNVVIQSSTAVIFRAESTDANLKNVTLYVDGAFNQANTSAAQGNYTFIAELSSGQHTWFVKAYDQVNNFNQSSTRSIEIDNTAPSALTYVSPTENNNAFLSRNWYYVNITFSEINPASCRLDNRTSNLTMTRIGTNCFINQTSQSQAAYTY